MLFSYKYTDLDIHRYFLLLISFCIVVFLAVGVFDFVSLLAQCSLAFLLHGSGQTLFSGFSYGTNKQIFLNGARAPVTFLFFFKKKKNEQSRVNPSLFVDSNFTSRPKIIYFRCPDQYHM